MMLTRAEIHEDVDPIILAWGETIASTLEGPVLHIVYRKHLQQFNPVGEASLEHATSLRSSSRLALPSRDSQFPFPGSRAVATEADTGPTASMTPTVTNH